MFQLIVSDLDGTLLNNDHQLSKRTVSVVSKIKESGLKFVLATGRHYQDVKHIAQTLGNDMYLITSNGAQIHDKSGKLIYQKTIDCKVVESILAVALSQNISRNIYQAEQWLIESENIFLRDMHSHSGFSYKVSNFSLIEYSDVSKMFFVGPTNELQQLEKMLNEQFSDKINVSFSLTNCLEVMAVGVSKGEALKLVLQKKSIQANSVIAFGDGMNDYDMLKLSAHPVLMENADSNLKAKFSVVNETLSSNDDGVAFFLEHLLTPKTEQVHSCFQ